MNKQQKAEEVESFRSVLKEAPPVFVLSFSGLTVNQVANLRMKVRATSSRYKVVKNRLLLRALGETPLKDLASHFRGPTAIAYTDKEPAALAKALHDFARENQGLQVKAGFVDGRVVGPAEAKMLADLPSREGLVAQLLMVLNAPATRLLQVLQGTSRSLVQVLDQIAKKKQETEGAAAPEAGSAPPA